MQFPSSMNEDQIKEVLTSLINPLILFSNHKEILFTQIEQKLQDEVVMQLMTISSLSYSASLT